MFGLSIMKIQHIKIGGMKLKHCLEKELCRYIHREVYNGCKGVGRGPAETDPMDYAILHLQKSILQTFHKSIEIDFYTCENVCVRRRNKIPFNVLIHTMKRARRVPASARKPLAFRLGLLLFPFRFSTHRLILFCY